MKTRPLNVAIFASGGGSNAQAIINYFASKHSAYVSLIITNRSNAGVIERAKNSDIPYKIISRSTLKDEEAMTSILKSHKIDFIVLAGFLLLVPDFLCRQFPYRIVNIHPALLPKYGGNGMYGHHVHEAVKAAGESETGITIHYVNENYDEGGILFQKSVPIDAADTAEEIAAKVLKLEHMYYPRIIEACADLLKGQLEEE